MGSAYRPPRTAESITAIVRRVLLNLLLAYVIGALVTFAMILASEVASPSDTNPYLGQAVGGTAWVMGWFSLGSPAVLFVLVCLDWGLRRAGRPRLVGAAVSLLPAACWLAVGALTAAGATAQLTFALWLLLVGLGFGRLMALPPGPTRTIARQ